MAAALRVLGYMRTDRDVHINFPGGAPVDGPSAGAAMAVAAVSALTERPVDGSCAITGEISVQGYIRPVGGVPEKLDAARRAGLVRACVPRENMPDRPEDTGLEVYPLDTLQMALDRVLLPAMLQEKEMDAVAATLLPLAAKAAD